ncbi:uncharacterized protein KY384_006098 [Bacidia gigantensis]|uniref:uncharacterized protein n=1 Tax=Bacidia gigantensis TaxID=2732470 RepID=UPI001D05A791|nr:uncharacterized protein KY384_006098 [Bacidia gigantensis]KAG8529461.1 hypothetical protein KY384_006098 [Bacidia gigantensis]
MESMKSLNNSLPSQSQKKGSGQKQEDLLQVFKSAALSVTNLYRTAEANDTRSRQAGYQEALDELLTFLDRENIGLDDGEGWKIRRWATARLDDQPARRTSSDSEEEKQESMGRAATPPQAKSTRSNVVESGQPRQAPEQSPSRELTTPPVEAVNNSQPLSDVFTFRSMHPYPIDTEMPSPGSMKIELSSAEPRIQAQSPQPIAVNVLPRGSKTPRGTRHAQRSVPGRGLGSGAGSKRKVTFDDFFDVGVLDTAGSSKRGRTS